MRRRGRTRARLDRVAGVDAGIEGVVDLVLRERPHGFVLCLKSVCKGGPVALVAVQTRVAPQLSAQRAAGDFLVRAFPARRFRGAERVPEELGGLGALLVQQFDLLIDLAEADTNIAQALRSRLALVEDRLVAPRAQGAHWLKRFGKGWTEMGSVKSGETMTKVTPKGDGYRVDGETYYSEGTIFGEWIDTCATCSDTGTPVIVLVNVKQPGVTIRDDWSGFGQRLTSTRTTVFKGAKVDPDGPVPFETPFRYQTAFDQLVLNSVLTGAALTAVRDVSRLVATRKRTFLQGSGGTAGLARNDPQILQVIGKARVFAYAAAPRWRPPAPPPAPARPRKAVTRPPMTPPTSRPICNRVRYNLRRSIWLCGRSAMCSTPFGASSSDVSLALDRRPAAQRGRLRE